MARKRNLTISEENEINWNDGMHSDSTEKQYIREMERGLEMMAKDIERNGQDNLIFDPMQLVV